MKQVIIAVVIVGVLGLGAALWWGSLQDANAPGSDKTDTNQVDSQPAKDVASLANYQLPTGWQQQTCPDDTTGKVYLVPADAKLDCGVNPAAPVSLMVDPRDTKDCQHLTAPNGVKKHTCKTLFIDDKPTVTATTEYPKSQMYPKATTITDYYIDTGNGVLNVNYTYGAAGTNSYQVQFDTLVNGITIK